jgi:uncharacterized membrane protein
MPDRTEQMIPDTETYRPLGVQAELRRQASKVWFITFAITAIWVIAILAAPTAKLAGVNGLASALYTFFSYICHQIPERSFHLFGEQFGVCSRCFGVYFGLLIGILIYPLWRGMDTVEPLPRFWLFLSLIPITIDWSLTVFGLWENTQFSRVLTGGILGLACAMFIMPALVEITLNAFSRTSKA